MNHQKLEVVDIPWREEYSKQCEITFRNVKGSFVTCFSDEGYIPKIGEILTLEPLHPSDEDWERNEAVDSNPDKVMDILLIGPRNHTKYELYGRIVAQQGSDAIVDCGGVLFSMHDFGKDSACIGKWVKYGVTKPTIYLWQSS